MKFQIKENRLGGCELSSIASDADSKMMCSKVLRVTHAEGGAVDGSCRKQTNEIWPTPRRKLGYHDYDELL